MSFRHALIVTALLLLAAPTARAQDAQNNEAAAPAERVAVPRSGGQVQDQTPRRSPRAAPPAQAPAARAEVPVARADAADDDQRRGRTTGRQAEPRGSRPRGDNPQTGTAVPRDARRQPVPDRDRGRVYGSRPQVYNNYYYPRGAYPYGYGAFGLGYFYYDPYSWYGPSYYNGYGYGGGWGTRTYGSSYYTARYGYPVGYLRLRVEPREAQVFVDGYFAGEVDEFDGVFQSLTLEDGSHHIEIVAPGQPPLEFDVNILPGQKVTYRGDLRAPRP